jgi:hypothetical protein
MIVMRIQAVGFDIGGVLEFTPDLGVTGMWESRLGLAPGELDARMYDAWRGGSIGTISEDEVHQALAERLGILAVLYRDNAQAIKTRLRRTQYRPGLLGGFLASTGLDLTPSW